jgi:hypothetical protein
MPELYINLRHVCFHLKSSRVHHVSITDGDVKRNVLPVLNKLPKKSSRRMVEWRHSSIIYDLDTRWRWVVRFTPAHGTHKGGWAGLRAGLNAVEKRKFLVPAGRGTLVVQSVVLHYTDWAISLITDDAHFISVHIILGRTKWSWICSSSYLLQMAEASNELYKQFFNCPSGN